MKEKVVLITGASSGIGEALAREFQRRGYRVFAAARRLESVEALRSAGISVVQLDVTNHNEVENAITSIAGRAGRIDILINNAGYGLMGPLLDIPEAELLRQFHTNVFGPVQIIKHVAPLMRKNGGGIIVNIGSISGIVTTPYAGAYCASKAAIHSISDALRMELRPFGIRVVTIQPGGIQSNFGAVATQAANKTANSNSWYSSVRRFIDKRANESQVRAMPASDLARAVVRLLHSDSPPAAARIGTNSTFLPLLKLLLPAKLLDRLMSKRYGLDSSLVIAQTDASNQD